MSWQRACAADDVGPTQGLAVDLEGVEVVVARDGEQFFALHNLCSHAAVALSEGEVDDGQIECWLHGSRFDLRTGKPTCLPATEPVAAFPVEVRPDGVYVDPTTTLNGVTPS